MFLCWFYYSELTVVGWLVLAEQSGDLRRPLRGDRVLDDGQRRPARQLRQVLALCEAPHAAGRHARQAQVHGAGAGRHQLRQVLVSHEGPATAAVKSVWTFNPYYLLLLMLVYCSFMGKSIEKRMRELGAQSFYEFGRWLLAVFFLRDIAAASSDSYGKMRFWMCRSL